MANLLLLYLAGGILLILLAIPLYMGKIKPNPWYGFRVRKTLQNPKIWYAVNKVGAVWMIVSGIGTVFIASILSFVPGISVDVYATLCALVFAGVLTVGMVLTFRYMDTL